VRADNRALAALDAEVGVPARHLGGDIALLVGRRRHKAASAVVHPSCSINHLKLRNKLHALAVAMANEVVTPVAAGCCGFAGDRGSAAQVSV
jgi:hypothetical protein